MGFLLPMLMKTVCRLCLAAVYQQYYHWISSVDLFQYPSGVFKSFYLKRDIVKGGCANGLAGAMSRESSYSKKELISALRQSCQRHLVSVLASFFERASASLLAMAANAQTNRLQTLYLDAQRLVRSRRGVIEAQVTEKILSSFAVLDGNFIVPDNARASHSTPYNHLELLGNEDLEVMIALDNGSTKVLETYKKPLYLVHKRFETLVDTDIPSPSPLSPDGLMEAFAEAVADGMIAVEIQVELINLFNELCFDRNYGKLLDRANQLLEDAGIFPAGDNSSELIDSPERIDSLERIDSPKPADSPERIDSPKPIKSPYKTPRPDYNSEQLSALPNHQIQSLVDKLSPKIPPHQLPENQPASGNNRIQTQLLTRLTAILENTSNSESNQQNIYWDKQQLFSEIDRQIHGLLKTGASANAKPLVSGQMTRQLEQMLGEIHGDGSHELHRNDASVFQVVGNTFSRFGCASAMAPDAQQVINRCELPLLKLALDKPALLEQENHPIRRLFNEMAEYAISLEQGSCADNKIYQQMLKLSEKMLSDTFSENQIPRMLTDFMAAVDDDRRITRLQEQRQLEEVAAREKINWAHTRVEKEINDRLLGRELPVAILNFVEQHWCKVLHIAHLRGGEASAEWRQALRILDRLLEVLRVDLVLRDKQAVAQVLKDIDGCLRHIAIDELQRKDQMDRLQFILTPILPTNVTPIGTGKKGAPSTDCSLVSSMQIKSGTDIRRMVIANVQTEMPGENIADAIDRVESLDFQAQQSLGSMQKGCWIELLDDIKSRRRGKLAGIVGPAWKYVFVNNKGKLVAELNRARLATELDEGKVTLLDNSNLFDKAIKAAIDDIKELSVAS
jgi:hypothetical protein